MAFFDGLSSPVTSRFRVPGVLVLAGGMVGSIVAAAVVHQMTRPHRYALVLDARDRCGAYYFSAFEEGPVITDHDASDGKTLTYTRNFSWSEGCAWKAVETLTPVGEGYRYHYDEQLVSCPAGVEPTGVTTPRSGFVHVRRIGNDHAGLTPTTGSFALQFADVE